MLKIHRKWGEVKVEVGAYGSSRTKSVTPEGGDSCLRGCRETHQNHKLEGPGSGSSWRIADSGLEPILGGPRGTAVPTAAR